MLEVAVTSEALRNSMEGWLFHAEKQLELRSSLVCVWVHTQIIAPKTNIDCQAYLSSYATLYLGDAVDSVARDGELAFAWCKSTFRDSSPSASQSTCVYERKISRTSSWSQKHTFLQQGMARCDCLEVRRCSPIYGAGLTPDSPSISPLLYIHPWNNSTTLEKAEDHHSPSFQSKTLKNEGWFVIPRCNCEAVFAVEEATRRTLRVRSLHK